MHKGRLITSFNYIIQVVVSIKWLVKIVKMLPDGDTSALPDLTLR